MSRWSFLGLWLILRLKMGFLTLLVCYQVAFVHRQVPENTSPYYLTYRKFHVCRSKLKRSKYVDKCFCCSCQMKQHLIAFLANTTIVVQKMWIMVRMAKTMNQK